MPAMQKPPLVRTVAVQIATLVGLCVVAFVAYAAIASRRGQSRAESLCAAVPVGTGAEAASQVVLAADTEPLLRWTVDGTLGAGFRGAFGERWTCTLSVKDGQVVAQEVRLID